MRTTLRTEAFSILVLILLATGMASCTPSDQNTQTGSAEPTVNPEKTIQVDVVDKQYSSIRGASNEYQIVTDYEYDETGKVIKTSQSTNYPSNTYNLCEATFEYSESGKLKKVSNAYEQYDWNVGSTLEFSYNDAGDCSNCNYTITSQGIGRHESTYEYDQIGRVQSATVSEYSTPAADPLTYVLLYEYSDESALEKATSSSSSHVGLSLDEGLSNKSAGIFAYRDLFGSVSTLRFDQTGNLKSVDTTSLNGGWDHVEYEYKTITVKSSDFAPSVYSNPTGISIEIMPQLNDERVAAICGEDQ